MRRLPPPPITSEPSDERAVGMRRGTTKATRGAVTKEHGRNADNSKSERPRRTNGVGAKRAARVEPRGPANDRSNTDPLAEARCLRTGRSPPRRQRAAAARVAGRGAWDFRTTDRISTMKDLRGIPAPTHSAPPRRKTIVDTGIDNRLPETCLTGFLFKKA